MSSEPVDVLSFWFGPRGLEEGSDQATMARWFTKDPAFDEEIRSRFGGLYEQARAGALDGWAVDPTGRLALVIVLDQFPRNMFRGTGRMFESDAKALRLAREGIVLGHDQALGPDPRSFLYMPLMHAEDLPTQEECVELFGQLRDETSGTARERAALSLDFARRHRDIVKRFGHFPHRNALLGRDSSPEERAFLEQPGSSF